MTIIQHVGRSAFMGWTRRVTAVPSLELPTAPIGSLAGFGTMRIHPGWVEHRHPQSGLEQRNRPGTHE